MASCTGSVFTVFGIIWFSVLRGTQMSVNLKDKLSLSSTSTNPNYPVSTTTDGIYGPFDDGVCMASDPASAVFWRGTFTSFARIQKIDIVFRSGDQADGYQFWISNGTSVPSGIKCYEDVESGRPDLIQNITSCNITGKTLIVYITRTSGYAYMGVCEVDVYGCFIHKYGDRCQNNCTNCKHGCDPDNGVCDSPYCNAGWSGARFCNQPCSQVTFGENCLQTCHCKTPGCNSKNGVCLIPGCQAGYSGVTCSQECIAPYFGNKCASQCRCRTHGCSHIDGTCTVPGCQDGWMGTSCSTQCKPGYFGADCTKQCHCKDAVCNYKTGNCSKSGCLPGWRGNTCSERCGAGSFGETCSFTCPVTCKDFVCHHQTGHCLDCYPGKYGVVCGADCPDKCTGNICSKDDGQCLTTESPSTNQSSADPNLTITAVLAAVCGLLFAALIALVIYILRKRQNRKKSSDKGTEQSIPDTGYTSVTRCHEETPHVYEMVVT